MHFYQYNITLFFFLVLLFTTNYQFTSNNLRGVLRKTTIVVKLVLIVVLCSQGIVADFAHRVHEEQARWASL